MNNIIKKMMDFHKLSLGDLAERTGIAKTTLYGVIKRGSLNSSIKKILALASALDTPVEVIVGCDWVDPESLDYQSRGINYRHISYWSMVMNQMLRDICLMMKAEFGWITLRDDNNTLAPQAVYGARSIKPLSISEGITGYSVTNRATFLAEDVSKCPEYAECIPAIKSELCCPLMLFGRALGAINLESEKYDRFSIDDAIMLRQFSDQMVRALASSAVLSEPRFSKVWSRLERLEYSSWEFMAEELLDKMSEELGSSKLMFLIFMYDRDGLYCIAHKEPELPDKPALQQAGILYSKQKLLPFKSITGEAVISNREVFVRDLAEDPRFAASKELSDIEKLMKSMLVIPLPIIGTDRRPIGTLNIISVDQPDDFTAYRSKLRMYSELISFTYLNAKLHKREAAFRALKKIASENLDKPFADMLHKTMIQEIVKIFGARAGSIFIRAEDTEDAIQCIATTGLEGCDDHKQAVYSMKKNGITYEIYEGKTPVRFFAGETQSPDMMSETEIEIRQQRKIPNPQYRESIDGVGAFARSFLGVPIVIRNESIGVIRLVSKESDVIFTKEDEELLLDIARILAPAIMNGDIGFLSIPDRRW